MRTLRWLSLVTGLLLLLSPAFAQDLDPVECYNTAEKAYIAGQFDEAFNNYSLFCNILPKEENSDYARIFMWISRTRLNHKAQADLELAEALDTQWNAPPKGWVTQIASFFLGQISEADLLAAADLPGDETVIQQHCEVWYYIGVQHLITGDKTTAIADFQKCLDTKVDDFTEYSFAQAELKALGVLK